MPNTLSDSIAVPAHLALFVRGAIILIVIFSVYNYLRALYFGRVISRISDLGAVSQETAKSAREIGCAGFLGRFWLRRRSSLRKLILTSEESPSVGSCTFGADRAVDISASADSDERTVGNLNADKVSGAEELSEEAEAELIKKADMERPQAPFEKALFYIPESRLEAAKIRYCDSRFDNKGSPVTLVVGCLLLLGLGELFIRNYVTIASFLFGIMNRK